MTDVRDGIALGVPPAIRDMTEKEWQTQVVALAKPLGWRTYHTHDSRRSAHGFPDLCLVRDRVIWLELKTEKGKLSDHQRQWLQDLRNAQEPAYVCRPRHLQPLAETLASRQMTNGELTLDQETIAELN